MNRLTVKKYGRVIPPFTQGQILISYARSFLLTKCRTIQGNETELELQLTNLGEEIGDFSPFRTGLNVFLKDGFSCLTYRNRTEYYVDFECLCCPDVIESASVANVVSIANAKSYDAETGVEKNIPVEIRGEVGIRGNSASNPLYVVTSGGDEREPFSLGVVALNGRTAYADRLEDKIFVVPSGTTSRVAVSKTEIVFGCRTTGGVLSVTVNGYPIDVAKPFYADRERIEIRNTGDSAGIVRFDVSGYYFYA